MEKHHYNWCPVAIQILRKFNFCGTVFVPLYKEGHESLHADQRTAWELQCLDRASAIAIGVPSAYEFLRISSLAVESSLHRYAGKIVVGHPLSSKNQPHRPYYLFGNKTIPVESTLQTMLVHAVRITQSNK